MSLFGLEATALALNMNFVKGAERFISQAERGTNALVYTVATVPQHDPPPLGTLSCKTLAGEKLPIFAIGELGKTKVDSFRKLCTGHGKHNTVHETLWPAHGELFPVSEQSLQKITRNGRTTETLPFTTATCYKSKAAHINERFLDSTAPMPPAYKKLSSQELQRTIYMGDFIRQCQGRLDKQFPSGGGTASVYLTVTPKDSAKNIVSYTEPTKSDPTARLIKNIVPNLQDTN